MVVRPLQAQGVGEAHQRIQGEDHESLVGGAQHLQPLPIVGARQDQGLRRVSAQTLEAGNRRGVEILRHRAHEQMLEHVRLAVRRANAHRRRARGAPFEDGDLGDLGEVTRAEVLAEGRQETRSRSAPRLCAETCAAYHAEKSSKVIVGFGLASPRSPLASAIIRS